MGNIREMSSEEFRLSECEEECEECEGEGCEECEEDGGIQLGRKPLGW